MSPKRSYSLSLFWIGMSTVAFVAVIGIVRPNNEVMLIPVMIHAILVMILLGANPRPIGLILGTGLVFRFLLLYFDLNTEIPVFSSGQDTENFYRVALMIYEDPDLFGQDLYGGVFPQLIGAFFWVVGPQRLLVQYLNVLLGVVTLILIAMSANIMKAPQKSTNVVLLVCALMPISASVSAIFLREALITFLVSISVYWFCCWFKNPSFLYVAGSLSMVACAGIFHMGVFGIIFGYVVAFFLYDPESGKFLWTFQRIVSMLPILGGFVAVILAFSDIFLEKLETVSSTSDLVAKTTNSIGGSAYLPNVEINSTGQFLLFGGLKALLMLVSPPPWVWRNGMDIISFLFDGLPFLVALIVIIGALRTMPPGRSKKLVVMLSVSILTAALVIGSGTANSGTAMRHRQKVLPVVAVAVIFALPARRNKWQDVEEEIEEISSSIPARPINARRGGREY